MNMGTAEERRDVIGAVALDRPGVAGTAEVSQIVDTDPGCVVELVHRDRVGCGGCGQPVTRSGRVAWLGTQSHDLGDVIGGWSHQHGCGSWNAPVSLLVRVGADADIEAAMTAAADELHALVVEDQAARLAAVTDRLVQDLADAAAHPDDDTYLTGSDTVPGVYRDADGLVAWAYPPTVSADDTGEYDGAIVEVR